MEEFLDKMAELLEEDKVDVAGNITEYDAWDSLTSLSIIVMADDDYGVRLSANDIIEAKTIGGLYEVIQSKK